ncbi:MAG: hemerythrin domain-containing protein [Hyalangium sp.]|uniref:hemerythrin domain-containing protein n=1 Tax=Hyalangium sp. TaxID=2028555 RepID=UPI00389990CB
MGPFDILAEQHRELEECIEALEADESRGEPDTRRERLEALFALLRVHAQLEERHLYPLLARVEGRARAREEAEDHLTLRELMEELEELEPEAEEWWARLTALEDLVVAHARQEEVETFPLLLAILEPGEQDELRRAFSTLREQLLSGAPSLSGNQPLLEEPLGDG